MNLRTRSFRRRKHPYEKMFFFLLDTWNRLQTGSRHSRWQEYREQRDDAKYRRFNNELLPRINGTIDTACSIRTTVPLINLRLIPYRSQPPNYQSHPNTSSFARDSLVPFTRRKNRRSFHHVRILTHVRVCLENEKKKYVLALIRNIKHQRGRRE